MIRKTVRLMLTIIFSIAMLVGCANPTEIVTMPPPTATQVPASNTLPPPTNTPAPPTLTLEQSQTASSINEIPQAELEALVALYNSTGGNNWTDRTNWWVTNTPSNWYGLTVSDGHIIRIKLSENQLTGTIPLEIGNLNALESLDFNHNVISGDIPEEIASLTALEYLDLCCNQLTGGVPTWLENLTSLRELYLSANQLGGSIPPEAREFTIS